MLTPKIKKSLKTTGWWYLPIFLVPLLFNPYGYIPYEIPKIAWLMFWVAIGISALLFMAIKGIELRWNPKVTAILALWIVSLALSTINAVAPFESFWGTYERLEGFLTWLFYGAHFLLCLQLFHDRKTIKSFFTITLWLGVLIAFYAILQYLKLDPFPIGDISLFSGRSYSTVGQPTMLGQWLIFPFFIAGWHAIQSVINKKHRTLAVIAFLIICAGLDTTLNRATFMAIGITILIAGFIYLKEKIPAWLKWLTVAIAMLFFTLVIVSGTTRSINSRFVLWEQSLPLVQVNPILGGGLESFYQTFQLVSTEEVFETESFYDFPDRAHNITLQILLDQGIFGFAIYLFTIGFMIWYLKQKKKKHDHTLVAALTILASYITLQFSFLFSAHTIYLLAMWAILLNGTVKFKKTKIIVNNKIGQTAIVILATILLLWTIPRAYGLIISDHYLDRGINTYIKNRGESLDYFVKLAEVNPCHAYPYKAAIDLFADEEMFRQHPSAIPILQQFRDNFGQITSNSFEYELGSAQLNIALQKYQEADKNYKNAALKAPKSPIVYQNWALGLFQQKRYQEGIPHLEAVIKMAPSYITDKNDDRTRIFYKSSPLFLYALNSLESAYKKVGEEEKASELKRYK